MPGSADLHARAGGGVPVIRRFARSLLRLIAFLCALAGAAPLLVGAGALIVAELFCWPG
jgi:hypothetical protein